MRLGSIARRRRTRRRGARCTSSTSGARRPRASGARASATEIGERLELGVARRDELLGLPRPLDPADDRAPGRASAARKMSAGTSATRIAAKASQTWPPIGCRSTNDERPRGPPPVNAIAGRISDRREVERCSVARSRQRVGTSAAATAGTRPPGASSGTALKTMDCVATLTGPRNLGVRGLMRSGFSAAKRAMPGPEAHGMCRAVRKDRSSRPIVERPTGALPSGALGDASRGGVHGSSAAGAH